MNNIVKLKKLLTFVLLLSVSTANGQVLDMMERTEKKVLSTENYVKKDMVGYNYNLGTKWVDITYQIIRYSDGTTKISIDDNNWMMFNTEYITNEYTGEKSKTPIDGKEYINNGRKAKLIAAKKVLPKGYILEVENDVLIMRYSPLGLSYLIQTKGVSSDVWNWTDVSSFNTFRSKKNVIVTNRYNEKLIDLSQYSFNNLGINIYGESYNPRGGYYDHKRKIMYYVLDHVNNAGLSSICPDGHMVFLYSNNGKVNESINKCYQDYVNDYKHKLDSLTKIYLNEENAKKALKRIQQKNRLTVSDVALIYGVPTDSIVRVNNTDKVVELHYKNGDYVKFSKLKENEVFDCNIHRPNGIWKVWQDNNSEVHSQFVYTNGPYKGLIRNGWIKYTQNAQCLSCLDMVNWRMMERPGDSSVEMYEPSNKRIVHVSEKGVIEEDYKKMQEARRKAAEAEKDKKQEALYQSYCKKYGKANVDEIMLRNNIKVGMPFSVIKAFCNYKLTDDNGSSKWYDVKYGGTYYDENSNSFKPREYNFAALIREWSIRVENGVVKYVGHNK